MENDNEQYRDRHPPGIRLRTLIRPGTWSRLPLAEKIMVVQLVLSVGTFLLLIKLVFG